ncbi:RICIN domain-containing protein [Mycobacterium sp. 134]|uniref:RICIN domain-containing protein n=1 Tax=Mycobacterium sp. 134 TaxID=3400425 RepID=UPI003AAD97D2
MKFKGRRENGHYVPPLDTPLSLLAQHSRKVLDISGASTDVGAPLIQWGFHGGANQRFRFERTAVPGWFRIIAAHSGLALEAQDDADVDFEGPAGVLQAKPNDSPYQLFALHEKRLDWFTTVVTVKSRGTGNLLGVDGSSIDDGALVAQAAEPTPGAPLSPAYGWSYVNDFTGTFSLTTNSVEYLASPTGWIDLKGLIRLDAAVRQSDGTSAPRHFEPYTTYFNAASFGNDQRPLRLTSGDVLYATGGVSGLIPQRIVLRQSLLGSDQFDIALSSAFGPVERFVFRASHDGRSVRFVITVTKEFE